MRQAEADGRQRMAEMNRRAAEGMATVVACIELAVGAADRGAPADATA